MEKLLAELMGSAAAPLIDALNRTIAAFDRNSDNLERVIAGQEAAMAKLEGATGGTTRKRRTAAEIKADEAAAAAAAATDAPITGTTAAIEQPVTETAPAVHPLLAAPNAETIKVKNAKTQVEEDTPTANYRAADFSRNQVKSEFIGWLGETTDLEVRKERAAFVTAVGQHFGVKQPFHPTDGLADDDARKQTLFYLRRKREGLNVDFAAEYDFDGDPLADQTVDASEDDLDALG